MRTVLLVVRINSSYGGIQMQSQSLLTSMKRRTDIRSVSCVHTGGTLGLPFFFLRALLTILRVRPDTVHLGDALLSPMFFFCPRGIKRTLTLHGLDGTWRLPGYRLLLRLALRFADHVVAVSSATAEIAKGLHVPASRISVIPCGIALPPPSPRPKKRQILLLSRQVRRKGTQWFLSSVLPTLLSRHPDLRVVIAGDGPRLGAIKQCVLKSGDRASVDILGPVTDEKKHVLMAESLLLLVPNVPVPGDPEGFGIVCIEAASLGTPVVASALEGLLNAVIEGVTGTFFSPCSTEDCLTAIDRVLSAKMDPVQMREEIRRRFDVSVTTDRYVHDVF